MARYRDDHDAAVRRGDALERELEQARAELEAKERQLAEADEQLDAKQRELDKRDRKVEQLDKAVKERDAAAEQLDKLKRAGEARRKAERRKAERIEHEQPARESSWPARLRMWRSVVFLGEVWFSSVVFFLVLPGALMAVYLAGMFRSVILFDAWVYKAVAASVVLGLLVLPSAYAATRIWWLRRWAASRPYELVGYPDLLAKPPPKRDGGKLYLTLQFEGSPPADLVQLLEALDDELINVGTRFSRSWPITTAHSKHGTRRDNEDTNWHVHRWVRRLERKVLRHLHQVSPLCSVRVS